MRPDTNFPRKKKQPDKSFIPRPRSNPTNPLGNLIQLQPIFGVPWPTIVLEVGNSEAVSKLIERYNKCLGYTTQVNVFVGISYNRNTTRQTDSWWMCVAHRDTNAPQPPPGTPLEYPAPIIVGEFQKDASNKYPKVNVPIFPNASTWSVETQLLFYPEPIPMMNPLFPASFHMDVEAYRLAIVENRLPCISIWRFLMLMFFLEIRFFA